MRILHVTKKYVGVIGGDGAVVSALKAAQEAAGDEAWVLTSRCANIHAEPRLIKIGTPVSPEALDGVGLRRLTSLAILRISAASHLDQVQPDVVHTHTLDMGAAIAPAATKRRIPMINTCHILEADRIGSPLWKRQLELILINRTRFKNLVVLTKSCHDALSLQGIRGVVEVPNGFDALPALGRPEYNGPVRLVGVGRLEDHKGFDILIDAFAKVEALRQGKSTLTIVGSGSKRQALRNQAERLNVKVVFTGAVPPTAMSEVWAATDVYVMSSRFETGPLTFYEAWAAQLATISARVGFPQAVGRHGEDVLLFDPLDVDGLANAIIMLIDDPSLVTKLGSNGRESVSQLEGWNKVAAHYRRLYEAALT